MSGHSKWATIKHKKAALDAKKGKLFSKLAKEITVAAKMGGGDAATNPRLRTAVSAAREVSMPNDNITRAIKRGTGELEGVTYEEQTYEGYAPGGVAVMIQILTDNKNRSSAEIRSILSKRGGNMASAGSVAWIFERKGLIVVERGAAQEDDVFMTATDAGADDFQALEQEYEITTSPEQFEKVKAALEAGKIAVKRSQITSVPKNKVKVEKKDAPSLLKLLDELEDHDDVQNVWTNFEMDDDVMAAALQE